MVLRTGWSVREVPRTSSFSLLSSNYTTVPCEIHMEIIPLNLTWRLPFIEGLLITYVSRIRVGVSRCQRIRHLPSQPLWSQRIGRDVMCMETFRPFTVVEGNSDVMSGIQFFGT